MDLVCWTNLVKWLSASSMEWWDQPLRLQRNPQWRWPQLCLLAQLCRSMPCFSVSVPTVQRQLTWWGSICFLGRVRFLSVHKHLTPNPSIRAGKNSAGGTTGKGKTNQPSGSDLQLPPEQQWRSSSNLCSVWAESTWGNGWSCVRELPPGTGWDCRNCAQLRVGLHDLCEFLPT